MLFAEILGAILFVGCLIFFLAFPIKRDRFLFGNKSWGGALLFCCLLVIGLILSICLVNHVQHNRGARYIKPGELVNWDATDSLQNFSVEQKIAQDSCVIISLKQIKQNDSIDEDTFAKDNFYAIISQFADPGNIPSAHGDERRLAVFLAFLGIVFLSGLLVSSLVTLLTKRSDKWKQGLIHYDRTFYRYVAVIGYNEQTAAIVKQALSRKDVKYVLIQTRQPVEQVREHLDLCLDRREEQKVVLYYAERTSKEDIQLLHLDRAVEIYVLGEDMSFENEEDHDAFNINCLELISRSLQGGHTDNRKKCHVNFEYQSTFTAFKAAQIYQDLDKVIEFIPFNIHEIWAKKVLSDNFAIIPKERRGEFDVQKYYPIDTYLDGDERKHITYDSVGDSAKSVHVIIAGMNQMGTAFGLQVALLAHYPNFMRDHNLRTTITFIDDHAVDEGAYFRGRFSSLFCLCRYRTIDCKKESLKYGSEEHPYVDPLQEEAFKHLRTEDDNFLDIQWEFIQGNIASKEITQYILDAALDAKQTTTVAICFNHPQQSIATALYLPGLVFRKANQVLVYQRNSFDLLHKVANGEKEWKRYANLFPFGMIENSYSGNTLENTMACLYNYLASKGEHQKLNEYTPETIKEISKSWDELGYVDKLSNIDMAESLLTKIRSMGIDYKGNISEVEKKITEENVVKSIAYAEHMRWITERLTMGYRALTSFEQSKIDEGSNSLEYYRKNHHAYAEICSYEHLVEISREKITAIENTVKAIPTLLRAKEWLNSAKIVNKSRKSMHPVLCAFLFHGYRKLSIRYVAEGVAPRTGENLSLHHSFWMCDASVTKYQWYLVTGKNRPKWYEKNRPAVDISKSDIEDFLIILRQKTGLYFTLPSLKEWEYAARLSTPYLSKTKHWNRYLNYSTARTKGTVNVRANKRKQQNPLGIYNMLGNVWEWTRETVEGHKNCFYFCGGSWRFKKIECNMGLNGEQDLGYWYSYWTPFLKSDDIGCRLVWKFDIPKNKASDICSLLTSTKAKETDTGELLSEWFNVNKMVDVKEGFFIMGTENKKTDDGYPENWIDNRAGDDETPHHIVRISDFKVCSVPVTQELWNIVMGTDFKSNPAYIVGHNRPQTNVSYRQIVDEFLPKINKYAEPGYEYRLLTEAEWEYVAKGAHTSPICSILANEYKEKGTLKHVFKEKLFDSVEKYPLFSGSNVAENVAWVDMNCVQAVAQKAPISREEFEVYDMSGNIWEWVDDYYQTDFYNYCIKSKEYKMIGFVTDPVCTDKTYSAHVFRGGSWLFGEEDCRCTRPNYWVDSDADDDLGFRLALSKKKRLI